MKKRVLSLLLIRCLSLGLLPAGALAAGTQTVKTAVTVDYGAAIEAVEYLNQLSSGGGPSRSGDGRKSGEIGHHPCRNGIPSVAAGRLS